MSKVYLVGAGPGDPELLTLKGRRVLSIADSVLYDHLAPESLLDLAPPDAERVYVGKKRSVHEFSQQEICSMLIERARRGLTVVRLKGGDPFIFGRGGEEVEALADAGIPFEVVPGVTTPLGMAAYCGVPLTHREHTSVVTFLTGHDPGAIDWAKVGGSETLVFFMSLTTIGAIVERLIAAGRAPGTPALAVRWATRPDQQSVMAPLRELPARIAERGLKPPATIIVGEVVRLRDKLNWFERLPLFGQRIVVTRAAGQAAELSQKLRGLGADAIELPAIEIRPPSDPAPLDAAIARLDTYDWVIFTSVNGVRYFLERLDASPRDLRALRGRVCAIGPATARMLESLHLKVDLVPERYVAESLVEAFAREDLEGRRILLPRAAVARDVAPESLRRRGATVDVVEAYRTQAARIDPERLSRAFHPAPSWVAFTSSSTVKHFLGVTGTGLLDGVRIASIGPVTSETIRKHGLTVHAEACEYTVDGLVAAIVESQGAGGTKL